MFPFAIVVADHDGPHPSFLLRLSRFLSRPLHEKSRSLYARWRKHFPSIPFPVWLPFGVWFIARDDYLASTLTADVFEPAERAFLRRFIQPGMTVLDVGAHQGFYSLLTSKLVAPMGQVFAFEPSTRERRQLELNLRLNRCRNVQVQNVAIGDDDGNATLYVVDAHHSGLSSLRPPGRDVDSKLTPVRVPVARLDTWIAANHLNRVDFIKLDVEGGELPALRGALLLLRHKSRPVILVEVQGIRTQPWGYNPREILNFLSDSAYTCYYLNSDGTLTRPDEKAKDPEGNFVGIPEERVSETMGLFNNGNRP